MPARVTGPCVPLSARSSIAVTAKRPFVVSLMEVLGGGRQSRQIRSSIANPDCSGQLLQRRMLGAMTWLKSSAFIALLLAGTARADVAGCPLFPADNVWNAPVDA